MTQSTDSPRTDAHLRGIMQDRVIVITFGFVGEDDGWVPSHLSGLGAPIALNRGHEMGHAVQILARRGWAVTSPFTFRSKHHSSAWVTRINPRPEPALGAGPELAWTSPAGLDNSELREGGR